MKMTACEPHQIFKILKWLFYFNRKGFKAYVIESYYFFK